MKKRVFFLFTFLIIVLACASTIIEAATCSCIDGYGVNKCGTACSSSCSCPTGYSCKTSTNRCCQPNCVDDSGITKCDGVSDGCVSTCDSCPTGTVCNTGTNRCCPVACSSASSAAECDDSNPCTTDSCANAGTCSASCKHTNACTGSQICCGTGCLVPACSSGTCGDSDPCTADSCAFAGTCDAYCTHPNACIGNQICCSTGCVAPNCYSSANCDDGNPCTSDPCNNGGSCAASCSHTNLGAGQAPSGCSGSTGCTGGNCHCDGNGNCVYTSACNNNYNCETAAGETCANCLNDCNEKQADCYSGYRCCSGSCKKLDCSSDADCHETPTDNLCTKDECLSKNTCGASCFHTALTCGTNGDGCCPAGCTYSTDTDCAENCKSRGKSCASMPCCGGLECCGNYCRDPTLDRFADGHSCSYDCRCKSNNCCADLSGISLCFGTANCIAEDEYAETACQCCSKTQDADGYCTPCANYKSCADKGFDCGSTGDGCGNTLYCGDTPSGSTCVNNVLKETNCDDKADNDKDGNADCADSDCASVCKCIETDGGENDYATFGTVTDRHGKVWPDTCNGNVLTEYYCGVGIAVSKTHTCTGDKCFGGACCHVSTTCNHKECGGPYNDNCGGTFMCGNNGACSGGLVCNTATGQCTISGGKNNGESCSAPNECKSGFCVGGVCVKCVNDDGCISTDSQKCTGTSTKRTSDYYKCEYGTDGCLHWSTTKTSCGSGWCYCKPSTGLCILCDTLHGYACIDYRCVIQEKRVFQWFYQDEGFVCWHDDNPQRAGTPGVDYWYASSAAAASVQCCQGHNSGILKVKFCSQLGVCSDERDTTYFCAGCQGCMDGSSCLPLASETDQKCGNGGAQCQSCAAMTPAKYCQKTDGTCQFPDPCQGICGGANSPLTEQKCGKDCASYPCQDICPSDKTCVNQHCVIKCSDTDGDTLNVPKYNVPGTCTDSVGSHPDRCNGLQLTEYGCSSTNVCLPYPVLLYICPKNVCHTPSCTNGACGETHVPNLQPDHGYCDATNKAGSCTPTTLPCYCDSYGSCVGTTTCAGITQCKEGDGCCPSGCDCKTDTDCDPAYNNVCKSNADCKEKPQDNPCTEDTCEDPGQCDSKCLRNNIKSGEVFGCTGNIGCGTGNSGCHCDSGICVPDITSCSETDPGNDVNTAGGCSGENGHWLDACTTTVGSSPAVNQYQCSGTNCVLVYGSPAICLDNVCYTPKCTSGACGQDAVTGTDTGCSGSCTGGSWACDGAGVCRCYAGCTGSISASPDPCTLSGGNCGSTVSWTTYNCVDTKVEYGQGGSRSLIWEQDSNPAGSYVNWIDATGYNFYLVNKATGLDLGSVFVYGIQPIVTTPCSSHGDSGSCHLDTKCIWCSGCSAVFTLSGGCVDSVASCTKSCVKGSCGATCAANSDCTPKTCDPTSCSCTGTWCGDGNCDSGETCSGCPGDCNGKTANCGSQICCSGICKTPACYSAANCADDIACNSKSCELAGTCGAYCKYTIFGCVPGDGCCPAGCTFPPDPDCSCANGAQNCERCSSLPNKPYTWVKWWDNDGTPCDDNYYTCRTETDDPARCNDAPMGNNDGIYPGCVAAGWALDPDTLTYEQVVIFIDQVEVATVTANLERWDVCDHYIKPENGGKDYHTSGGTCLHGWNYNVPDQYKGTTHILTPKAIDTLTGALTALNSVQVDSTNCPKPCECTTGPCCDGCHYWKTDHICNYQDTPQYQCSYNIPGHGSAICGSDVYVRSRYRYCSGASALCNENGAVSAYHDWYIYSHCALNQRCEPGESLCTQDSVCADKCNPGPCCNTAAGHPYTPLAKDTSCSNSNEKICAVNFLCNSASCDANGNCNQFSDCTLCISLPPKGQCGKPTGTCLSQPGDDACDYTGDSTKCSNCNDYCNAAFACTPMVSLGGCNYNYIECMAIAQNPKPNQKPDNPLQCPCHSYWTGCI